MLVSGLKDASLSRIISNAGKNYAHVHESLRECAREMLVKYEKKQECSTRKMAKSLALKTLLNVLGDAPENPRTAVSFGLQCHALMLQGYEHLLSTKGNTYELMKQTQGLSEAHNNTTASLLQYHDLKNKLLWTDTPLSAEQKEVLSALAEKKSLTLKTLEILEARPDTTTEDLMKLNKTILHTPELCAGAFNHEHSIAVAKKLRELEEAGSPKPDLLHNKPEPGQLNHHGGAVMALQKLHRASLSRPNLCVDVLKHEDPYSAAQGLLYLNEHKLDTADNCSMALKHKDPLNAALTIWHIDPGRPNSPHPLFTFTAEHRAIVMAQEQPLLAAMILEKLFSAGLLEVENLRTEVFKYENPFQAIKAMKTLNKAGLFNQGLLVGVLEHESPDMAAKGFVKLHRDKMYTPDNYFAVFKHNNPYLAAQAIFYLTSHNLVTHENQRQVLKHEKPDRAAEAMWELSKHNLNTPDNCSAAFKYKNPLIAALAIIHLNSHQLLTHESLVLVMAKESPLLTAMVLEKLNRAGLLEAEASLRAEVSKHKNYSLVSRTIGILEGVDFLNQHNLLARARAEYEEHYMTAEDFVDLDQQKTCSLDTSYSALFEHNNPYLAARAIVYLTSRHLFTRENQREVFRHENPFGAACELVKQTLPPDPEVLEMES